MNHNKMLPVMYASKDALWKENLFGGKKITWYHASALDGRPIMTLRAMMNWSFGTDDENRLFQNIGLELRDTALVYNDNSSTCYDKLLGLCKRINSKDYVNRPLVIFDNIDASLASIIPFAIFTDEERIVYESKYEERTVNKEFDGFIIKLPWFRSFPELSDTVIFFCLNDDGLRELFDVYNVEVVAFFESRAGHEGSPGFSGLYRTTDEAKSIKYIFTDHYTFCGEFNRYLLCNADYSTICFDFDVTNLVKGVNSKALYPLPTYLPEHDNEKYDSINGYCDVCRRYEDGGCRVGCSVVGYGGGFCLARRS